MNSYNKKSHSLSTDKYKSNNNLSISINNNNRLNNMTNLSFASTHNETFDDKPMLNTKFGNTSQSIVSVPNIFLIRDIKSVETFNTNKKDTYFVVNKLFSKAQQLNINNNPMRFNRKYEEYNKKKYIPINQIVASNVDPENNLNLHYYRNFNKKKEEVTQQTVMSTEIMETKFSNNPMMIDDQNDSDKENDKENVKKKKDMNTGNKQTKAATKNIGEYNTYLEEYKKNNITTFNNPELAGDLKNSINKLLDRINSNYDVGKWTMSDTKSVFNKTNDIMFTPLAYYNKYNEPESSKFQSTLQNKIQTLSGFQNKPFNNKKLLNLFNKTTEHKDLEGKISVIDYSKIKKNNIPTINQDYIEEMTHKNSFLYKKYNPSLLYKEFPSATYSEFTKSNGETFNKNRKQFLKEKSKKGIVDRKFESFKTVDLYD